MSNSKPRNTSSSSVNLSQRGSRMRKGSYDNLASLNYAAFEPEVDYQSTGNFKEDFTALCLQKNTPFIPSVVPRPVPPGLPLMQQATPVPAGKPEKKLARRYQRGKSKHADLKVGKMRLPRTQSRMPEGDDFGDQRDELPVTFSLMSTVSRSVGSSGARDQNVVQLPGMAGVCPLPSTKNIQVDPDKPPLTFCTKDRLEYFQPTIQVEQENMEDGRTVREIYIRGWKVDIAMMEVLQRCLPVMSRLRLLHLWNAGLRVHEVTMLAAFLPQCSKLTTLVLDGNTLTGCPVSKLLGPECHLKFLSLRFCGLTEVEAAGIGGQLMSPALPLLSLLLTGNHIGDVGATYIADALRINRTLLTLNLSANRIKDEGAASLSVALSFFKLSHEQLVQRRQLLSRMWEKEKENIVPALLSLRHTKNSISSTKDIRGTKKGKEAKAKLKVEATSVRHRKVSKHVMINLDTKKGAQDTHKTSRSRRSSPTSMLSRDCLDKLDRKGSDSQLKKSTRRKKKSRTEITSVKVEVEVESGEDEDFLLSPLIRDVKIRDGQAWLTANRTLMSLNLMRNQMSERGLKSLLTAVEEQVLSDVLAKATQNREDLAPGLCRLEVLRNAASDNCPTAMEIRRWMRLRDPLLRSPCVNLEKRIVMPCAIPIMR